MIGEPDAGKPHVRFDEGVQETHGPPQRACALLHRSPPSGKSLLPFESAREQVRRSAIAERLVRAPVIVETKVALERGEQLGAIGEVAGVNQFVLQRSPQTFD